MPRKSSDTGILMMSCSFSLRRRTEEAERGLARCK